MTPQKEENIKKDYMAGLTYNKITKKYHISFNQLKYLIDKEHWTRTVNEGYKGNTNAKGNSGGVGATKGNKYAVTTEEYENIFDTVFSETEKSIYNKENINLREALIQEVNLLQIRELRMLERIERLKNKDMTVSSMSKTNSSFGKKNSTTSITTVTQAENTTTAIQRIEEALTRVQEAKRRCIESLNKIKDMPTTTDNTERIQIINDLPIAGDESNDTADTN